LKLKEGKTKNIIKSTQHENKNQHEQYKTEQIILYLRPRCMIANETITILNTDSSLVSKPTRHGAAQPHTFAA
jgi:hypothetical protein